MTGVLLRTRIVEHLPRRPEMAWDLCCGAILNGSPEEQNAALLYLKPIGAVLPFSSWTVARRKAGSLYGVLPPPRRNLQGACGFPVVPVDGCLPWFATITVVVSGVADDTGDFDCPETCSAISDALDAVRRQTGRQDHFVVRASDSVQGDSLGLAVAMAAYSAATGIELRDDLAATGRVSSNGAITRVGLLDEKVLLRSRARPCSTLLIPPGAGYRHPCVREVQTLANAIAEMERRESHSPSEELVVVRRAFDEGNWRGAAERGENLRLHPNLGDDERVDLLAMLLCAANHHADPNRGEEIAGELHEEITYLLRAKTPTEELARAIGSLLISRVDQFDASGARQALALADHWAELWTPEQRAHIDGSAALLSVLEGNLQDALSLRERSVENAPKRERPRCLGDWADVLWRHGDFDKAAEVADEAMSALRNDRVHLGYMRQTASFLRLHAARIARSSNQEPKARRLLQLIQDADIPDLRIRARLELASMDHDLRGCDQALSAGPSWMADSRVIQALGERARHQAGDEKAAQRLAALMQMPGESGEALARRLPY